MEIPPPGTTLTIEELYPDGAEMFAVTVADNGEVSYEGEAEHSFPATTADLAPASPPECNQSAYSTRDLKEYGTYEFWIGDGSMPAGLTRTGFKDKVVNSVENIIQAHNNCGLTDRVGALGSLEGYSTYESDMSPTSCGDGSADGRDHQSVWDAGNIDGVNGKPSAVARMCGWTWPTPGAKNDLIEADVRFNITDYDFTIHPGTTDCRDKYDLVSVGVHEAGHVYGLGHVLEADYPWMTMSVNAEKCNSTARTLGKGDVLGLESIY